MVIRITLALLCISLPLLLTTSCLQSPNNSTIGTPVDSLNAVTVYFSQAPGDPDFEGLSPELQDLALSLSSTEFVKRYYKSVFGVEFPDSLRRGVDFYDPDIPDGEVNPKTGLIQYTRPSIAPPRKNDIMVFNDARYNPGGHLAIVAEVSRQEIVIVQQSPDPLSKTREPLRYYIRRKKWYVQHPHAAAWLHKEE